MFWTGFYTRPAVRTTRGQGGPDNPPGSLHPRLAAGSRQHDKYPRRTGIQAGPAATWILARLNRNPIAYWLTRSRAKTEGTLAPFQPDGAFFADRPANPAAVTQVWIDQAFILARSVADCAKWTVATAQLAPTAFIPIDGCHIFSREEYLHHAGADLEAVSHAVLVAVA